MKKILFLILISANLFSQIKIKDLPTTTTGATGDFLLKDDAAGIPGSTKKISVANFLSTYIGGAAVTGSGTTNYVPKFTGATTIGNSLIFDNSISVAIGNASPTASTAFEVKSTTGGFVFPRMSTAQQAALTPFDGMSVFNNQTFTYDGYAAGSWYNFCGTNTTNTAGNYTKFVTSTTVSDALLKDSTSTWTVAKNIRLDGLKMPAGAGAAKVLTSDANGVASWAAASSSLTGATGDLISFSATDTKSNISAVATGNALISGGVSTLPTYGKIGLTTHVSGTLPIANGGTNITTYTTGDIVYASASNTLSKLPIGTESYVMTVTSGVPSWQVNSAVSTQDAACVVTNTNGEKSYFKAAANTDAARGKAMLQAFASMGAGYSIEINTGNYRDTAQVKILDGWSIHLNGAKIYSTLNTDTLFIAKGKSNWSLRGWGVIQGSNVATGTPKEIGLYISSCKRYLVENLEFKYFKFRALNCGYNYVTCCSGAAQGQGTHGIFNNLILDSNVTALFVDNRSEYNLFSNLLINYNTLGVDNYGGNNRYQNCQIMANVNGFYVNKGENDSHGTFVGGSINHNTGNGIRIGNIVQGWTFTGVDIYANDNSSNYIELDTCTGVHFIGGNINSPVVMVGTFVGFNILQGVYFPESYATFTATTAQAKFLRLDNCFTPSGNWNQWIDYSSTTTVTGFSGTPTKNVRYKISDGIMHIDYYFTGTSNATSFSFTIPYASATGFTTYFVAQAANNGSYATEAFAEVPNGSTTIGLYVGNPLNNWTASGTKTARGSMDIRIY